MITGLHHVGLLVDDLEAAVKNYAAQGFKIGTRFEISSIGAKAVMMVQGTTGVELFEVEDRNDDLARKIDRHVALASSDLEADVKHAQSLGNELVIDISNGDPVKRFAFLKDSSGNYVEIVEPLSKD